MQGPARSWTCIFYFTTLRVYQFPLKTRFQFSRILFVSLILLLFILLSIPNATFGQAGVMETNPPSVKWRQVNTPGFRVIFPKGFESQGVRVANVLEGIRLAEAKSLGSVPRKISVILQNQSSISNGFVSMFPRRSEFYAMPAQDYNFLGNSDWLDLLASHEYRHIVQYQHAITGFNKLFYYAFGATTMAGMAQAAAPSWFWEGDAVATETAFTATGRGKIPNFSLLFKTNLLEGRTFNYHKQYLRSYKHEIPNHYVLGYHMVNYLRKRTGDPNIWGKITKRSWSVPFLPFAFSNAIHNKADLYVTQLYREMADDLRNDWRRQIDSLELTSFENVAVDRHGYTDYHYPQLAANNQLVAMRSGIGKIAQFVDLNDEERVIFTPGFVNDAGMLSAEGSTIVWTEYGYHPRWLVKNYSLIKAYDVKKRKVKVVGSRRARYTSAAISPNEKKIVAIETNAEYKTSVHILTYPDGDVVRRFDNPANAYYSMPRWASDNREIVALKTQDGLKSIVILDSETGSEREVAERSEENYGYPVLFGRYLFFNSPITGIDNIFSIDLESGERFQVTSSEYGAYNPVVSKDGGLLYYNDQTRDGLDVVFVKFDPSAWKPYNRLEPSAHFYEHLVQKEEDSDIMSRIEQRDLPIKKYSKFRGLINPYTWGFYLNNDLTEGNFGVTSQDLLSTFQVDLGYRFNINERTSNWTAAVSYQGLFPIIDLSASAGNRSVNESFNDRILNFTWKEQRVQAGVRVPLLTTSSRFASGVTVSNYVSLTRVTNFENSFDNGGRIVNNALFRNYLDDGDLYSNSFEVTAYRLLKRSRRDINSKWGQRIKLQHKVTPTFSDFDAEQFSTTGILYFPGAFRNHSLWMYGAYQRTYMVRTDDVYIYQNEIPVPRGIGVSRFQHFSMGSLNYTLPVWYPDIALGPILNIQRLRATAFFDHGFGTNTSTGVSRDYTSTGIEMKVDFNVLRFLPQFDIGVRYSHGISAPFNSFELLIGTINL